MNELIDWEALIFTSDPVDTIMEYSRPREVLVIASLTRATFDTLYWHRRVRYARTTLRIIPMWWADQSVNEYIKQSVSL